MMHEQDNQEQQLRLSSGSCNAIFLIGPDPRLGSYVRRIALLRLGLEDDGEMVADIAWSISVNGPTA